MFDIGFGEVVVILIAALLLFGPKKLPELGRALGGSIKAFKEGLKESMAETEPKKDAVEPGPKKNA